MNENNTLNELLIIYFNRIIKQYHSNGNINDYLPKMKICGVNNFKYDGTKTLKFYDIKDGHVFTVLAGFNY